MAKDLVNAIRRDIEEGLSGVPSETLLYSRQCDRAQDNGPMQGDAFINTWRWGNPQMSVHRIHRYLVGGIRASKETRTINATCLFSLLGPGLHHRELCKQI